MSKLSLVLILSLICGGSAVADVWTWEDSSGNTHYVETSTAIYTWTDESGRAFYSDSPDHEDAVAVLLVWFSKGTLRDLKTSVADVRDTVPPESEESDEQQQLRLAREADNAHNCKRVTEIYDSYRKAPRLYRTNEDGEKEYLSKSASRTTIRETKAKVREFCG